MRTTIVVAAILCASCQQEAKPVIEIRVTEQMCYVVNLTDKTLYDVRLKLMNPKSTAGEPYVLWTNGNKDIDVYPGDMPMFQDPWYDGTPVFEAYSEGRLIPSFVVAQPRSPSAGASDLGPRPRKPGEPPQREFR